MKLEILICTIDEGIRRVAEMLMPRRDDVSYLVSWQVWKTRDAEVPTSLQRDDVRVLQIEGRGLSRNRNHAIDNAQGDVCLIADDDLEYYADNLSKVVECFERNRQLDFATFRYDSEADKKIYSAEEFDLSRFPKGYYVTSFELAFRRASVQGKLRFDEHFGLGAELLMAGEESVFVHDALAMGLRGRFFPITIASHHHPTTGIGRASDRGVIMANAAYLQVAYRHNYKWLRALLMAWRSHCKGEVPFITALRWVRDGIAYAKSIGR